MRKLSRLVVVLPLIANLWGCGPEGLEEPRGEDIDDLGELQLTTNTVTQELSYSNGGSWASPQPATPLSSTSDRACFFTRIRGSFDSSGDSVRILASRETWNLHGAGSTSAAAACATLPGASAYSTAYEWTAGQPRPTNMGSTRGRVCFLTRVGGAFNSPADWAGIYESGGSWFLSGASQARNGYARARCVTVSTYSSEHSWNQSQGSPSYLGRTSGQVCALTHMAGQFDGASEFIELSRAGWHWWLHGGSARAGVAAKARCF
ncbi:hypothetical protein [Hyalangium sp.]|uniref:hypothetical protein n=1 Tax=Hyalangium sp. TaxID=2028555 RepID=UPI002D67CD9E|nr:hypothetical protein [Hyalangium sp.]HYI02372.1 hypothetical protein [Hyalangium sp.]